MPRHERRKGHPFEVVLTAGSPIVGVVLADQLRSLDWVVRRARLGARAPVSVLAEVQAKLRPLLGV